MFLCDYHIHTKFSPDAMGELSEVVQFAKRYGIKEMCFTDHFENGGFWQDGFAYDPVATREAFDKVAARYQDDDSIKIRHGVEIGQAIHSLDAANDLLNTYKYDYVIGSHHNLRSTPDFYFLDYKELGIRKVRQMYFNYFDELRETVKWGRFDVLGHLDYPTRYFVENDVPLNYREFDCEIESVLKLIIQKGIGLEVNSSGLTRKSNATMPTIRTIKRYKELGGEIITTGSDSHRPGFVGRGIKIATQFISDCGFNYITTFEGHNKIFHKI